MDLMNLLRSIEALLYEMVSWLVFYPLTLWRCIRHPLGMMEYAEKELTDPPAEQFTEALSPPLFLFLTILLAHLLEVRIGVDTGSLAGPLADIRNLLLFRAILFSLLPLIASIQRVRQQGRPLTRATLRPAFYSQCYLSTPFVLAADVAGLLALSGRAGLLPAVLLAAGFAWYASALSAWFIHQHRERRGRAVLRSVLTIAFSLVAVVVLAVIAAVATGGVSPP